MKKIKLTKTLFSLLLAGLVLGLTLGSCKKDDDDDDGGAAPVASFQYEISETNFLEVKFTNFSQNATSYLWDFGDGETSTEANPAHVYDEANTYNVKLTASNANGATNAFSKDVIVADPDEARKLLTGEVSKTWKLFREGTSMYLDPDWEGLQNNGARPCLYYQEFTFHYDGTYVFDDKGMFWGEYGVFNGLWNYEICFEAIPENMINQDGVDVSAWLSGTHAFTYDPSAGTATLNGEGAWIGIPKLTTTGETTVPVSSTTFNLEITQETGYDLMTVSFEYDYGTWVIIYASYSDPALEPDVVEEGPQYGEDLPDLTPDEMYNTFETATSFVVLDTAAAYTPDGGGSAANNMDFTMGVADPAGGNTNVGEYFRFGTYQELQFMMEYDIQFDNFTTVSLDVYMPSSNDYSGTLTKDIAIVIGEASETDGWWTGHIQYDAVAEVMDEWVTYTFQLDSPDSGPGTYTPFTNDKLDFFAISLGGGGHDAQGTFYIRNFVFE